MVEALDAEVDRPKLRPFPLNLPSIHPARPFSKHLFPKDLPRPDRIVFAMRSGRQRVDDDTSGQCRACGESDWVPACVDRCKTADRLAGTPP